MNRQFLFSLWAATAIGMNPSFSRETERGVFETIACPPTAQRIPKPQRRDEALEALIKSVPPDYPLPIRLGEYALNIPISYLRWPARAINCPAPKEIAAVTFWVPDGSATAATTVLKPHKWESYRPKEEGRQTTDPSSFIISIGIRYDSNIFTKLHGVLRNVMLNYNNIKIENKENSVSVLANNNIYIEYSEKYISVSRCGHVEQDKFGLCWTELAMKGLDLKFSGSTLNSYTYNVPIAVDIVRNLVRQWSR